MVCPAGMVKTYESRFPPSPNLDKVTVGFEKLRNTENTSPVSFKDPHYDDIQIQIN